MINIVSNFLKIQKGLEYLLKLINNNKSSIELVAEESGTSYSDLGYSKFSPTESYSKGDVVEKDGKLYIFTYDHTGDWNTSHVNITTVENIIQSKTAYEIVDMGELSNYVGIFPDGLYTTPMMYGNTIYYEWLDSIWQSGKIPILRFSLLQHTASYTVILYKDALNNFTGHERADNGDYTIDVIIGSASGQVKTVSINKEMNVEVINDSINSLTCTSNTLYKLSTAVNDLNISLPPIGEATKSTKIIIILNTSTDPNISISTGFANVTVSYIEGYSILSLTRYMIECILSYGEWIIAAKQLSN